MALPRLQPVPVEDPIPNPLDDPEYAAAMELLGAFNSRHDRLEQERLRLHYEAHFGNRSPEDDGQADRPLRARLAALQALPPLGTGAGRCACFTVTGDRSWPPDLGRPTCPFSAQLQRAGCSARQSDRRAWPRN